MSKADEACKVMENFANDNTHGYDQTNRWGPDYDCSSGVITAWQSVGVGVKSAGATYTGNMKEIFLRCGFEDVSEIVNLSTGSGLVRGDVLLNEVHHTAMYCGNGKEVEFSINENGGATGGKTGDQTGKECLIRSYRNYPWDCVLRYKEVGDSKVENKKTTIDYVARVREDATCYLNKDREYSKMFVTVKKGTLIDVTKYSEEDSNGNTLVLVRIAHPTAGFVYEFLDAGAFTRISSYEEL